MRGDRIIAFVIAEAEREIRFDSIQPLVLQTIGADFVDQANAAAFLPQIKHHAFFHFSNFSERGFELVAAITAQ